MANTQDASQTRRTLVERWPFATANGTESLGSVTSVSGNCSARLFARSAAQTKQLARMSRDHQLFIRGNNQN
jgi:hypothetical protein